MIDWVKVFNHTYNRQKYNCAHFVVDIYRELTGGSIEDSLNSFMCGYAGKAIPSKLRQFKRLQNPEEACIILMPSPNNSPHVGIYHNGGCLHITEIGVRYEELSVLGINYPVLKFYKYE